MLPKIIAVVGPTASGKTELGIKLAKEFNGEIIAVDSRTVYKGMDIGTAKPQGEWRKVSGVSRVARVSRDIKELFYQKALFVDGVPHWGIDLVEPDEDFNVAEFKKYAEQKISEIFSRGHLPILVGGTGLWFQALIDNLDLPEVAPDPELRSELEKKSAEELFDQYEELDPAGSELIQKENKRRLVRALEVTLKTGKPFSELKCSGEPKYQTLQIGMKFDREELYERVNLRVDQMIARGLVTEVRELIKKYDCESSAMTGIGYRQLCFFMDRRAHARGGSAFGTNLEAAISDIKRDTRHYAKRQMGWFKRDDRINWVTSYSEAQKLAKEFL